MGAKGATGHYTHLGKYEHVGVEPDLTYRGHVGPYKVWVTSPWHVMGRGYKTVRGGHGMLVSSCPLV